jgi:PAS domain S-box-containing protein
MQSPCPESVQQRRKEEFLMQTRSPSGLPPLSSLPASSSSDNSSSSPLDEHSDFPPAVPQTDPAAEVAGSAESSSAGKPAPAPTDVSGKTLYSELPLWEDQRQPFILSIMLAAILGIIGLSIFFGWLGSGEGWGPHSSPRRLDLGLALICAALSSLALHLQSFRLSCAFAIALAVISFTRIAEYFTGFDSGLNAILAFLPAEAGGDISANMSVSLAFCLALVSLALLALALRIGKSLELHVAAFFSIPATVIGGYSLLSVLNYGPMRFSWTPWLHMSVLGGVSTVLLGFIIFIYCWGRRGQEEAHTSQLMKNVVVYSVLGVFFVAVFSAAAGMLPLYERLQQVDRQRLFEVARNKAESIEQLLARVHSLAIQVASRTRARRLLQDYNEGRISAEQLQQDSQPIFRDIELAEPDIIGLCRLAGDHSRCDALLGESIPPELWPDNALSRDDISLRGPFVRNGRLQLTVSTPIWSTDSRRLGTDIMLFTDMGLAAVLSAPARLGEPPHIYLGYDLDDQRMLLSFSQVNGKVVTTAIKPGTPLADALTRAFHGEAGLSFLPFSRESNSLLAYAPVKNSSWTLLAEIESSELDFAVNNVLRRIAFGVMSLIGLGCFIIYSLIRGITRHAESLQRTLRQRTQTLEHELNLRQSAEQSLLRQKEFLRQVIDLNPNLIFAKNHAGEFTLVNKAVAEAYGISVEELLGKTDADFNSSAEEVAHFRKDDLRVIEEEEELFVPEEELTDAQGNRRCLQTIKRPLYDENGIATQLLGVATDITIRKTAEETATRLAAIVESSTDAIIGSNLDTLITSWNHGAEILYGYSSEEALGQSMQMIVPDELRDEITEILGRLIRGERLDHHETVRRKKNGDLVHVSLSVSLVMGLHGRVVGVSSISRDITRRKEIEQELARYREELELMVAERTEELVASQDKLRQSERMASIGALASGIAHEINNPVGAILLASQNALEISEQDGDPQKTVRMLQDTCRRIIHNARRCGAIVKGVLQFSREQRRERIPTDMNVAVKNAVELVQESMNAQQCTIELKLARQLPRVVADPIELEQVIVNLVKNSIESVSGAVHVVVETDSRDTSVFLKVADDGCGIAKDQLKHIFDPFFTTRQRQGGTGLGLSVVHGIVNSHGGNINVQSTVGVGTTITITLPAYQTEEGTEDAGHTHC